MKNTTVIQRQARGRRYGHLWIALACALLCACGQSGKLYLPPDKPAELSDQG